MALVEFEIKSNNIGVIRLNDPDHLNAITPEMAAEFKAIIRDIKKNNLVRVLIITGIGKAFSAGGNLNMLKDKAKNSLIRNKEIMLEFYHSFLGILDLKCPVISAINGHAVGAGMCLAAASDFRISVVGVKLGFNFLKLGLHPGMAASLFLPRIVGYPKAIELLTTGKIITSEEASLIGLVNKLSQDVACLAHDAIQLADSLLAVGPQALGNLLETLRPGVSELQKTLEREAHCQSLSYASAEFLEGITAAIEKRDPKF